MNGWPTVVLESEFGGKEFRVRARRVTSSIISSSIMSSVNRDVNSFSESVRED